MVLCRINQRGTGRGEPPGNFSLAILKQKERLSTMEDYEIDEDDFINDAINDAEEYEPDDDYGYGYDGGGGEEGGGVYMEPPDEVEAGGGGEAAAATGGVADTDAAAGAEVSASAGEGGVPPEITAGPSSSSPRLLSVPSPGRDLFEFERYTGQSTWRTAPRTGDEKTGATVMEATGWRKRSERPEDIDGGNSDDEEDGMDRASRRRPPPSTGARGGTRGGNAEDARLVSYCEEGERDVLGLWDGGGGVGTRGLYGEVNVPGLGEGSMAVTLEDGTRTFVRRKRGDGR